MEEAMAARYWCHMCSQMVSPIMEVEIKCPFCQSGFVEEMGSSTSDRPDTDWDLGPDRALPLWAPILLGMMGNPRCPRRLRRLEFEEDDDDNDEGEARLGGESGDTELDRELESIISRRRRNSATIFQLLQGVRAGMTSESENSESDRDMERDRESDRDRERDRERERVILINPFNRTIIVQGSSQDSNQNQNPIGSLSDYFIGPGLDLLLQHLVENDPNRYGTPPAQKEAVEALPFVTIKENLQCSVCLDDFEIGSGVKEMPCRHKFHSGCIVPWLELHSSCPVCRFQLPGDESNRDQEESRDSSNQRESDSGHGSRGEEGDGERRNASGRMFSIPWPFNGLFSSSSSQSGGGNFSSTSSPSPNAPSQTDEN